MKGLSLGEPIFMMVALSTVWVFCSLYVARTTPLRTNVRYLHAILSFPVLLLLIPVGVALAMMLVPMVRDLIESARTLEVVSPEGRRHLAELSAILLAAPLPAFLFWRYRSSMDRREQRALERFRGEGI